MKMSELCRICFLCFLLQALSPICLGDEVKGVSSRGHGHEQAAKLLDEWGAEVDAKFAERTVFPATTGLIYREVSALEVTQKLIADESIKTSLSEELLKRIRIKAGSDEANRNPAKQPFHETYYAFLFCELKRLSHDVLLHLIGHNEGGLDDAVLALFAGGNADKSKWRSGFEVNSKKARESLPLPAEEDTGAREANASSVLKTSRVKITQDLGKKLKTNDENARSVKEFFMSYGTAFPDGSHVNLKEAAGHGFEIVIHTNAANLEVVKATCEWFNRYSEWFSVESVFPDTSDVAEARYMDIVRVYNQQRESEKEQVK